MPDSDGQRKAAVGVVSERLTAKSPASCFASSHTLNYTDDGSCGMKLSMTMLNPFHYSTLDERCLAGLVKRPSHTHSQAIGRKVLIEL